MKFSSTLLLILFSFLYSCTDNLADVGANIQPDGDGITIGKGIFNVVTENSALDALTCFTNPDFMLLGEISDNKYGTTKAEVLAELMHPTESSNPNTVVDSAKIILTYSFRGDTVSPIQISAYEMTKRLTNPVYYTNIDANAYCDKSILLGKKIIRIKKNSTGTDTTCINLSKNDAERLFKLKEYYNNHENFMSNFKGIYLTTDFGKSTMLYLHKTTGVEGIANEILIRLYTHYTYKINNDSVQKVYKKIDYVANTEVRQLSRITHPDRSSIVLHADSNYISSPANFYTKVTIPMKTIRDSMELALGSKKRAINRALLKVEVTVPNSSVYPLPIQMVDKMVLMKKDTLNSFLISNKLFPANNFAIVSSVSSSKNATTGLTEYFYSYDLSALITNELKTNKTAEKLEMVLLPVQLMYSIYYAPKLDISAVTIKSGQNKLSPMVIKMIYSGF